LDGIYAHVCPKCGGLHLRAASMPDFDLKGEIERLAREVYDGHKKAGDVDSRIANKVAVTISQAVAEGYAQQFTQVAWESPDWEMIRNLQRNVYQFSFAKSYEQLKATTAALHDGEGHVIPFNEFRDVAGRINNEYNVNYLRTEYDTAIGSAQMASRWVQFTADQDDLPLLRYETVGDANVRPEHARLSGVLLPLHDPFWDAWYPPNGWGCRCDVTQHDGGVLTDKSTIIYPEHTPRMFQTNLGKSGLVFPAGHPYFTHLPETVLQAADNQNPFLYTKTYNPEGNGYVYDNPLHNHGADWAEELKTAKLLADAYEKLILLPEINNSSPMQKELRKLVLPKQVPAGKNPDGILPDSGKTIDLKVTQVNTKNAIDTLLRKGKDQADIICIRLTGTITNKELKRAIKGRVMRTDIREVWIIKEGQTKPVKYTREQITGFK